MIDWWDKGAAMLAVTIGDCQRAAQTKARRTGTVHRWGARPALSRRGCGDKSRGQKKRAPRGECALRVDFSHGDTRMAPDGFRVACTLPCRVDVRVDGARMHAPISNGNRHLRVRMLVALAASMPGGPNVWN